LVTIAALEDRLGSIERVCSRGDAPVNSTLPRARAARPHRTGF
jgi:hypothetical protein